MIENPRTKVLPKTKYRYMYEISRNMWLKEISHRFKIYTLNTLGAENPKCQKILFVVANTNTKTNIEINN